MFTFVPQTRIVNQEEVGSASAQQGAMVRGKEWSLCCFVEGGILPTTSNPASDPWPFFSSTELNLWATLLVG